MAFRQAYVFRIQSETPVELSGNFFCHSGEVQQYDAQAQIAVDLGVVNVRTAYQGDSAFPQQETVGLTI